MEYQCNAGIVNVNVTTDATGVVSVTCRCTLNISQCVCVCVCVCACVRACVCHGLWGAVTYDVATYTCRPEVRLAPNGRFNVITSLGESLEQNPL